MAAKVKEGPTDSRLTNLRYAVKTPTFLRKRHPVYNPINYYTFALLPFKWAIAIDGWYLRHYAAGFPRDASE